MPKQNSCPKCGTINSIIKYGKNNKGVQRYQCKSCLKSFILDETPLSHLHISDYKFKIFLGYMIDDVTLDVITMINLSGICVARVSSRAMALPDHYKDDFTINMGNLKRFIHDGNTKQYQFMNQFKCEKINARKDESELYSTKMIDSLHSNLKRYFFKHAGFRLKNIQHYLNFFVYRYNHLPRSKNTNMTKIIEIKNQMILDLFNRIILVKKSITYNDFLNDKGITDILESR